MFATLISDGIPEKDFSKNVNIENNQQTTKIMENYPTGKQNPINLNLEFVESDLITTGSKNP